ncbi:uncharacterized protein LOC127008604 [Eriocheir sinensis]|uniref:uncharacterized protein LOC127008604 n=1 Tax=Eriocheir sinensis TaxID=95602 RepID=UPI0021C70C0F|nr:uncharacterized protein LOC127008604 [Eriocheir sinensis]XP_050736775.1 uncharacterized protein LOC127008604 [Eriocheir sinensis]
MDSPNSPPCEIPVVDFGGLIGTKGVASEAEWQRVGKELHDALSGVGFVYLSNHGVTDEQISNLFNTSASFFSLPEQTKASYESDVESQHGYNSIGREELDAAKSLLELRESFYMKNMDGAFPDAEVPLLRPAAAAFVASSTALAQRVLTALALGLGLERDFFTSTHQYICNRSPDANSSVLRINHYPPLAAAVPENAIRCGAHTDYGSITLLFQDSMGGLQVRGNAGEWVHARPIPGTVLVNAGDLLQIWTANRLKATEHRVIIPKEETRLRASRLSAAFFVHPDNEVVVRPIDGASSPPPIKARQHLLNMYAKTYKY